LGKEEGEFKSGSLMSDPLKTDIDIKICPQLCNIEYLTSAQILFPKKQKKPTKNKEPLKFYSLRNKKKIRIQ